MTYKKTKPKASNPRRKRGATLVRRFEIRCTEDWYSGIFAAASTVSVATGVEVNASDLIRKIVDDNLPAYVSKQIKEKAK